jgi:hypothetical protein
MTHTANPTYPTTWTPPTSSVNHAGQPLEPTAIFFAPPPTDIGELLSGSSTLEAGKAGKRRDGYATYTNWLQAFIWTFLAGFLSWFILVMVTKAEIVALIAGSAIGAFTLWRTLQKDVGIAPATCTCVGTKGVAQYVWDEDESKRQTPQMFRFEEVAELRTLETRHFINGAYQHTLYVFEWLDTTPKSWFNISGVYRSQQSTPPAKDRYHFALAAERAWSAFAFERAKAEFAHNGVVRFNVKNGDALTLGNGFVEIKQGNNVVRSTTEDMAKISIKQGVVTLSSKDTKRNLFGTQNAYSFKYHDIGNAKLFLILFDALVG